MKHINITLVLFFVITMLFPLGNRNIAQTKILDDFEKYADTESLSKAWRIFGFASTDFQLVVDSTEKVAPGGNRFFQYTYNATTSTWGGVAERIITDSTFFPLDLSAAKAGIQFYLKGDGTDNVLRFRYYQYFNKEGTIDARWRSQTIPLSDTSWHIVRVPFILDSTETKGLHLWYTNGSALQTEEDMLASLGEITRFQINLDNPDKTDLNSYSIYFDDFRAMDFFPPDAEGDIKIADFEEYSSSADFKTDWQGFGYGTLDYVLGRNANSPEGYKNAVWVIEPEERTTWGMAFRSRKDFVSVPDLSSIGEEGGIQFLSKGDGTDDQFVFRFTDAANNYWGSYWIPLQDTTWHTVNIPFVVDSLKGFRWLGNDPNGTYWTTDIGTPEMFRASLDNIIELRFDKRKPLHDEIKRFLEFDAIYALQELPPLPPASVDDFENYTDSDNLKASWNQFGTGSVSLELSESEFVSGSKAMLVSYNGAIGYTAVRKRNIIPGLNFSEFRAGVQFWLKGDGSNNKIVMRLQSGNEMWETAELPMNLETWQHIGVDFKADSISGFRYLGNNPDNPIWSTDIGTNEQLTGDIANIDQVRFYVRNPEATDEVKTFIIDNIEGVDKYADDLVVSVDDDNQNLLTTEFNLEQNYPNPFNPTTTINYSLRDAGIVSLKVYNILGQEVISLVNEFKNAGLHQINFNASSLASGIYIYQINSGSFMSSKKMLLLK